jgi:hypothetical protein
VQEKPLSRRLEAPRRAFRPFRRGPPAWGLYRRRSGFSCVRSPRRPSPRPWGTRGPRAGGAAALHDAGGQGCRLLVVLDGGQRGAGLQALQQHRAPGAIQLEQAADAPPVEDRQRCGSVAKSLSPGKESFRTAWVPSSWSAGTTQLYERFGRGSPTFRDQRCENSSVRADGRSSQARPASPRSETWVRAKPSGTDGGTLKLRGPSCGGRAASGLGPSTGPGSAQALRPSGGGW